MKIGQILYYIFFIPVLIAKGIYYTFSGINFLMKIGLEFADDLHNQIKEF